MDPGKNIAMGLPWLVWMLIVGHAAAAIYHHRTLLKMIRGQ